MIEGRRGPEDGIREAAVGRRKVRLKLLETLARSRHCYVSFRAATQTLSIALLWAIPLSGLARVDLWQGRHRLLFTDADLRRGLAGVVLGIAALYVATFLSNAAGGRLFCGWGCPVGQISRLGESVERAQGRAAWKAHLQGAAYSAAFVFGMLAWWVDLRVLWRGDLVWSSSVAAVGLTGTALALAHARVWRWGFCRSACPIGLYYSFVSPARWFGVHFRNETGACVECDLCDRVCPVDLAPRDLMAPIPARAGLSIADAPGRNHCLECGDCVRACDWMIERRHGGEVPLRLGFFTGEQRRVGREAAGAGQDRSVA